MAEGGRTVLCIGSKFVGQFNSVSHSQYRASALASIERLDAGFIRIVKQAAFTQTDNEDIDSSSLGDLANSHFFKKEGG